LTVQLPLLERIGRELTQAMKARDALRTATLRLIRAAVKNREIEKRGPLEEADLLQLLTTLAKQRREAIEQFRAGGREDLAVKEEAELAILGEFLPEPMGPEELEAVVRSAVAEVAARGPQDLGKVMAAVMPRTRGRVEGGEVNRVVRAVLSGGPV
jgi:uncharacterized protein YqeY